MARVVHFEFAAEDPERASGFYRDVFGWQVQKWDGPEDYWLVSTGAPDQPGIDGAIMHAQEGMPSTINTIDVQSVDETVEKIVQSGGKVAQPKMAVPGIGWMAYCLDTEGNMFGVMQGDPTAA
jgi:hypothetical protein